MKNYNIAADLLVLAKAYYNKGQKKDACKLFVRAMEEEDSGELVDFLDDTNESLDPMAQEEQPAEEVLSDEEIDEILEEDTEEPEEPEEDLEEITSEDEFEEPTEEEAPAEELPELDTVVSQVMNKKAALANLASLSGTKTARQKALRKFLSK